MLPRRLLPRLIASGAAVAALLASAGAARAQCDTRFTLRNQSGVQVNEFYFDTSANPNWGNDRLGQGVLPNDGAMSFSSRFAGAHDFKVVWANGQTAELMRIDICATNEIVATPRGLVAR